MQQITLQLVVSGENLSLNDAWEWTDKACINHLEEDNFTVDGFEINSDLPLPPVG